MQGFTISELIKIRKPDLENDKNLAHLYEIVELATLRWNS